ncbi:MAG: hypothetical protein LUD81_03605 [Clostridiales bacterium]|nr:hypothetical protein [Clostridiales bacterium]
MNQIRENKDNYVWTNAIDEMFRVCREIRIFPVVDLDANNAEVINNVIDCCKSKYYVETVKTNYEFQKGADKLLVIKKCETKEYIANLGINNNNL